MEQVPARGEKKIPVDHVNIRLSISFLVMKLIFADFLVTIILIVGYYVLFPTGLFEELRLTDPVIGFGAIILLTIVESMLGMYIVLEWVSEYYEISPYAVVHKRGVLFKKEDRYGMQNIKQVTLVQGFFGRILNYGTINLFDWRLSKCAELYAIHNPHRYTRILEKLLPNVDEHRSTFGSMKRDDDEEENEGISA